MPSVIALGLAADAAYLTRSIDPHATALEETRQLHGHRVEVFL